MHPAASNSGAVGRQPMLELQIVATGTGIAGRLHHGDATGHCSGSISLGHPLRGLARADCNKRIAAHRIGEVLFPTDRGARACKAGERDQALLDQRRHQDVVVLLGNQPGSGQAGVGPKCA